MRVLWVGFAITPYYRDFLNRIQMQSQGQVAITNIRPAGENRHLGAGVHQDFAGIEFRDLTLREKTVPPRRWLGLSDLESAPACLSFDGLAAEIREWRPQVIVYNVNFHGVSVFDPDVVDATRIVGAKVILHSIPFQLPHYDEAIRTLEVPRELPMRSLPRLVAACIKGLRLDAAYLRLVRRRAVRRRVDFRRTVFRRADAHAVYHEGGISVYTSYGVPSSAVRVVRNSPNTVRLLQSADKYPRCDAGARLIHVGRLVEWKRVDLLIRILADLRQQGFPDADLLVIGYGPCETELRALARELNLDDAVRFCGGVYEPDKLAELLSTGSIYVMAGMGGLSINEAMCFSLPILCSRGDGTETFLVRERENGLYFEEGNEESLRRQIVTLLSNPELRKRMGQKSRRIIEDELNTRIHVNNYLTLFDDLVPGGRSQ